MNLIIIIGNIIGFIIGLLIVFIIHKIWIKFKNKKNPLPTLYDKHNNPIIPPKGSRYSKNKHKYQRATLFTKEETEEILQKESIKAKELKS